MPVADCVETFLNDPAVHWPVPGNWSDMHFISSFTTLILSAALGYSAESSTSLENKSIAWSGKVTNGKLQPVRVLDRTTHESLPLAGECFQVELGDGAILESIRISTSMECP